MSNSTRMRPLLTAPALRLAPEHCAVLVIDMQNDFCAPGGYVERVIKKDPAPCSRVAGPINQLVVLARECKVPVLWLRARYEHGEIPEPMHARLVEQAIADTCCAPGTWGYDWHEVRPAAGEQVADKRSYDGFLDTQLEAVLHERGVRTIVFAGVQTNICVESTLRRAHSLGFYCVVPQDCVASHTPPAHETTLNTVRFLFGDVCSLADVTAQWRT